MVKGISRWAASGEIGGPPQGSGSGGDSMHSWGGVVRGEKGWE